MAKRITLHRRLQHIWRDDPAACRRRALSRRRAVDLTARQRVGHPESRRERPEIPSSSFAVARPAPARSASRLPADGLCLMLGTNRPALRRLPAEAAERMRHLHQRSSGLRSAAAARSRRRSCRAEHGVRATRSSAVPDSSPRSTAISPRSAACHSATPSGWDIPVVFDGVHFSEQGHRRFAEQLEPVFAQTFL
ncbi:MAG: hypothetical protein ACLR4Z_16945 [Butyricicoccaceae bacterium]